VLPNTHTTSYNYDQRGRRLQRKLPLGQAESYTYDASGNLLTRGSALSTMAMATAFRRPPIGNFSLSAIADRLVQLETEFGVDEILVQESESFTPYP
jgi:YD repeat-containing protein